MATRRKRLTNHIRSQCCGRSIGYWNGAPPVQTAAKVPVYSCDSTRIKQGRRCRECHDVSHPAVSVFGPGNASTIPGPR